MFHEMLKQARLKIGENMSVIREEAGFTIRALHKHTAISESLIYKYERGLVNFSLPNIYLICDALDVSLARMFEDVV